MTQRCHDCGKFRSEFKAWKMYYSGFPPIPDEGFIGAPIVSRNLAHSTRNPESSQNILAD